MDKIALLFPGQGSQKIGMGCSFAESFPAARSLFEQANEILGFDLRSLCSDGPDEALRETENAQTALYVVSVAAWTCFTEATEIKPEAVAGHSVGEYAALVAAGVLDFADGLKLVRRRGELMRDAAKRKPGTMAAILGLDADAAREVITETRNAGAGLVAIANYNGGGQIVISGEPAAVEAAGERAKARGAKRVIPLNVSGAFHSPLMVTAGDTLAHTLLETTWRKPKIPIVSNVTADYVTMPDDLTGGLTRQISGSVLWEQSMQKLLSDGFDTFVELGSGDVLSNLMKRIDKSARAFSVQDAASLEAARELLTV